MKGRPVFIVRRRFLSLPLFFILFVLIPYVFFCDRAEDLDSLPSGETVILAGFVEEVFSFSQQDQSTVYKLQDLSGEAYLVSQKDPPREGTVLVVWATKSETDAGRSVLIEKNRVGDFLWKVILYFTKAVTLLFGG